MQVINFVFFAAVTFVAIQTMTPFLYDFWYGQLRDQVTSGTLLSAGDAMFGSWQVMSMVVPGLIIIWGVVQANNKRPQEYA